MTQKIYKTARGKSVDLGAVMLKNENTLAVGNMHVNARGDEVTPTGVVTPRSAVVSARVDDQIERPRREKPASSKRAAEAKARNSNNDVIHAESSEDAQKDSMTTEEQVEQLAGLAAAIARTKVVQQDELTPPSKQARKNSGVTRL